MNAPESTEQKAAIGPQENEHMLVSVMRNLPGLAYRRRNDAEWTMEFASEGCRDLTGYAPADFLGGRRTLR